jgi:hypothetical protein
MASQKPLIIDAGTTQRIPDADTLVVGVGIDAAAPGVLTIGGTTATSITLGSATIPVSIPGDVTTVGGTTFTTDATFEGNVTFGAGAADTVTFAALTTVTSDINFGGAPGTYKITNLANGTNPNDAVNFSQLSAIVSGVSSFQTSLSGLTPSSATGGAITLAGTLGVTSGGTGTTTAFTQGSVVFAGASGVYDQDNANLFWDDANNRLGVGTATPNEALTVSGVVSIAEGASPSNTAAFGKLWASGAADARPYWTDDTGTSFNLTLDRFNTLTPAASVAIDTNPALPIFNSLSLDQDTTFSTSNLGDGRSASVRVVCDGTTRNLTFPGGWTWLGSGPPSSLAANDVGYLSITAYGATDADVVAAWSYENQPAAVTGSGVDNQISIWSGTDTQDGSANLTFDGTTLGVTGAITQSGGAVSLTGNAASSVSTTTGDLTLDAQAASLVLDGGEAAADAVRIVASNAAGGIDVDAGTGGIDINTTGATSITSTGLVTVVASSGFDVDAIGASTVDVEGTLTITTSEGGDFVVSTAGEVDITASTSASLTAPAWTIDINSNSVTWPTAAGTAGQVLTNDGAGALTWSTGTDSTLVTLTTAQAANTAVTVGGAAAIATAASTARVAGIVTATNTVKVLGICTCDVEGALSIAAGDVVYLSASEAGAVTNVAPSTATQVVAELGIATAADSGGTVAVLWQPKAIIVL